MKDLNKPLVDATIVMYLTITSQLMPTPAKSHYTFNLKDLSKVFQGMLMVELSTIEVSPPISIVMPPRGRPEMFQCKELIGGPTKRPQFPAGTVFWYCSMNVITFPLAILPSTSSMQTSPTTTTALPWHGSRGMATGSQCDTAWPLRTGWSHRGPDRGRGLSCYQPIAMEASAPPALLGPCSGSSLVSRGGL